MNIILKPFPPKNFIFVDFKILMKNVCADMFLKFLKNDTIYVYNISLGNELGNFRSHYLKISMFLFLDF